MSERKSSTFPDMIRPNLGIESELERRKGGTGHVPSTHTHISQCTYIKRQTNELFQLGAVWFILTPDVPKGWDYWIPRPGPTIYTKSSSQKNAYGGKGEDIKKKKWKFCDSRSLVLLSVVREICVAYQMNCFWKIPKISASYNCLCFHWLFTHFYIPLIEKWLSLWYELWVLMYF